TIGCHLSCIYLPRDIVPFGPLCSFQRFWRFSVSNKNICVRAALALLLFAVFTVICIPAVAQSAGGSGYHLVKKVKLGGTGGWDYLEGDPATHRLFISRGTHYIVVDPDQG